LCAKDFVGNEPFAVTLADDMIYRKENDFLKKMITLYEKKEGNCNIVALKELNDEEDISEYGVIKSKKMNGDVIEISDMIEKPTLEEAPSRMILTGRYIFEPKIFDYLEKTAPGKNNEIQVTDAMKVLMREMPFYGLKFNEERFDCGKVLGYLEANIAFALFNPKLEENVKKMIKNFYNKIK
jgi:UTP--glucose-1-phosphate uridylyltransferase